MKNKLTLIFCLVLFVSKAQIYTNYFEGIPNSNTLPISIVTSTNNIWRIGKPKKPMFNSAVTSPNVMITDTIKYYPKNNTSRFIITFKQPFIGGNVYTVLRWKQKLDMDSKKDGGIIEFSTNSGNTWQNAHNNTNVYQFYGFQPANKDTINGNEYCFSGRDTTWRDVWFCLKPSITNLNDTILYRFTFKSDNINTNKEGWMIDNLSVHPTMTHPVKEISQIEDIVIYPNITGGIVNVEMKKTSDNDVIDNIELLSIDGKIVESYGQNYTKVVLDISNHDPGIYYMRVTSNKKTTTHKIIYEKN